MILVDDLITEVNDTNLDAELLEAVEDPSVDPKVIDAVTKDDPGGVLELIDTPNAGADNRDPDGREEE